MNERENITPLPTRTINNADVPSYIECELHFEGAHSVKATTYDLKHDLIDKLAIFEFDWSRCDVSNATKQNLVSASIRLNGSKMLVSLYFKGIVFQETLTHSGTKCYKHVNNKHGVGCTLYCNDKDKIIKLKIEVDYINLKFVLDKITNELDTE